MHFLVILSCIASIIMAFVSIAEPTGAVTHLCGSDEKCRTTVENMHKECYLGISLANTQSNGDVWQRPCAKAKSAEVIWTVSGVSRSSVHINISNTQSSHEVDIGLNPVKSFQAYNLYFDQMNPRLIRIDVNTGSKSTVIPTSFVILAPYPHCRPCLKFVSALDSKMDDRLVEIKFHVDQKCATAAGMQYC